MDERHARTGGAIALLAAALAAAAPCSAEPKRYLISFREGTTPAQQASALERLGASAADAIPEIATLVAELDEAQTSFLAFEAEAGALSEVLEVQEDIYRKWIESSSFQALPFAANGPLPEFPRFAPSAAPVPAASAELPWGVARVNAPAAWARTRGEGVKVAVLDTGIDCSHPDLRPNCERGYNAVGSGAPADDNGHGTHVAATVAGALDGAGVAGVAPRARLYPVKVLDRNGGGGVTSIIKGLIWAGRHRMDVANLSLSSPMGFLAMRAAVMYAAARGVTVVCAAGNDGGAVNYPAAYPETIAVSALEREDRIAPRSSRGREIDLIAPGVDVRSAVPGGAWARYSGTSMAAPHVSGLAALAVARGARGREQVLRVLRAAARPIAGLREHEQGAGVVDAGRLVR